MKSMEQGRGLYLVSLPMFCLWQQSSLTSPKRRLREFFSLPHSLPNWLYIQKVRQLYLVHFKAYVQWLLCQEKILLLLGSDREGNREDYCSSSVVLELANEKTIARQGRDNWVNVDIFLKTENTGGKSRFRWQMMCSVLYMLSLRLLWCFIMIIKTGSTFTSNYNH